MAPSRSRGWCLTLNNWTPLEYKDLETLADDARYCILGQEVGEGGTPHIQGYFYFPNARRLSSLRLICRRAHWEIARGDAQSNFDYCSKDGQYAEFGTMPQSAADRGRQEAARWDNAKELAISGQLEEIPSDIYIRYYRTLKTIRKDHMPLIPDANDVTGVWFWGRAGVGKSRRAREEYPLSYMKMCNKWWDGYQDQATVIIDDIDSKHAVLGHHLKIWADRYAFLAETKGGALMIRPEKIIVTSQYRIDEIWEDQHTIEALCRRFQVINIV